MREILFRGKRTDGGEWVYGFLCKSYSPMNPKTRDAIMHENNPPFPAYSCAEIDVATVGQFTGLTDRNGKRIFEGDICRNTKTGETVSVVWHGTMAGFVWSRRKEGCKHLFDFGELFRCFDKYEVIGNIHDNPELLKGGEE